MRKMKEEVYADIGGSSDNRNQSLDAMSQGNDELRIRCRVLEGRVTRAERERERERAAGAKG